MRAHSLRPVFDRLDSRLLLDGGGGAVCVAPMGTSVPTIMSNGNQSPPTGASGLVNWNLPGSPGDAAGNPPTLVASSS
jgi:hypothetical protein